MKQNDSDISRSWIRKFRDWTTLSSFRTVLQYNLNMLELAGYVSSKNDYQDILNDIAKDIINRWKYQINRKEDILKVQEVQKQLDLKTVHYLEKLDYYNKYIETCLENLESGKKRIHKKIFSHHQETKNEVKNMKTLKYLGSKLYEKGILLEIKDLDIHQYKNVLFEVRPSQDAGIFIIDAKFMGIPLNSIHIDIQDLLAMKYQGTAVMNIFDCVKINSNLLL
ncbi:Ras GTPase-activating-like protein IQGAP2, partial [Stegodyphus mimosarum]